MTSRTYRFVTSSDPSFDRAFRIDRDNAVIIMPQVSSGWYGFLRLLAEEQAQRLPPHPAPPRLSRATKRRRADRGES